MGLYIALCNYTADGIKAINEAPSRVDRAKALLRKLGGEMKAFYLTMGSYDLVVVYELPDDQAAATFALMVGQVGAVRTTTLKAFSEAQYRDLVKSLA